MLETRLRTFADNTGGGGSGTNFTVPLIPSSGGTGTTAIGSATTLVGVNSSGAIYDFYLLKGSDNATVVRSGSAYFISATTSPASSGAVYAATGNNYAVLNFAADLTAEYRLVQSGNNITVDTTGNLIVINATTGGASSNSKIMIGQSVTGTSATRYGGPFGMTLDAAQANVAFYKVPFNGTAKSLYFGIQTSGGAPASGRAWVGQVWKGTTITALTCSCFEIIVSASDLTNTVSFNSGDILSFGYERTGTAAGPGNMSISIEYDPS